MRKTLTQLNGISTKNLLRYYKAERSRFYAAGYFCDCGCHYMIWEARNGQEDMEAKYNEHLDYLNLIKSVLNTREHIKKPV